MLRSFYRCALHLHPPAFRKRFGDEMLSIFDQPHGTASALRLLLDALFSLSRQWTLRPEFWHDLSPAASPQPASDGIPSFYTISPFRPRGAAVVNGLVLSLAVFCMTCFAIRYSWIHVLHVRIPEVQFERPSGIPPNPRTSGMSPMMEKPIAPPPPVYKAPSVATVPATPALPQIPPPVETVSRLRSARNSGHTNAVKPQSNLPISKWSAETIGEAEIPLESYEGTYVVDSPAKITIVIATERDSLMMSISRQPRLGLTPMSKTKFTVEGLQNCWIEFTPGDGAASPRMRELQLSCNGKRYVAHRQP